MDASSRGGGCDGLGAGCAGDATGAVVKCSLIALLAQTGPWGDGGPGRWVRGLAPCGLTTFVHVSAGAETRQYQGGGYKDRFLTVTLRVYVQEENAVFALEKLFEDIETVLEDNAGLSYEDQDGKTQSVQQITILSLDTDEGALEPLAVGEIICEVRY